MFAALGVFWSLPIDTDLNKELVAVYDEIMWLAVRPNITPSVARSWYTHATAERLKKRVRMFTGLVSENAVKPDEELRLEHYLRIQTTLTQLVKNHVDNKFYRPEEFVDTIMRYEQVHIVTNTENYSAMKAKGDYLAAGINLVKWDQLNLTQQEYLWRKMLRGKVANHKEFEPRENA